MHLDKTKESTLSSYLFENPNTGIKLNNFLQIEIPVTDIKVNNNIHDSKIVLNFIDINFSSFSDIEGTENIFPINPDKGYIDGSVYLEHQHIYVDVLSIQFGKFIGNDIQCSIKGEINFMVSSYPELPNISFNLTTNLTFSYLWIPPDLCTPTIQNKEKAKNLIKEYFTINELTEPEIINNGFQDQFVFGKNMSPSQIIQKKNLYGKIIGLFK